MHPGPLPKVLPVFPMTGPLLLPSTVVSVDVEEEGLREAVDDALAADGYVALLQPRDTWRVGDPLFYSVGCLGRVGAWDEEEPEGCRALIEGLIRFRVREELPLERSYHQVRVSFSEFVDDRRLSERELRFPMLRDVVRDRIENHRAPFDPSLLQDMAGTEIVTALAHALPFHPAERQALVETPSLRDLEHLLLLLMARGPRGEPGFDATPLWPS
jgi:Lon protease-like protein